MSIRIFEGMRGRVREQADLSATNWFRVGGNAEYLFRPADVEDLAAFIKQKPETLPMTILGVGSNVIIRDGGVQGVVIKLGRGFTEMEEEKKTLHVGAGCLDVNVAMFAAENSIANLEFLSGIPGTIGGALRMNAGAYGTEMKDVLIAAELVDDEGKIRTLNVDELGYGYRHCALPKSWIFTKAIFRNESGNAGEIMARISEIQRMREESQPIKSRTGGSTFRNPENSVPPEVAEKLHKDVRKAWQLIDVAGCRGLELNGAKMSEKHCNFMLNTGTARAKDLEMLGEEVRKRVKAHSGISLIWEIERIGKS